VPPSTTVSTSANQIVPIDTTTDRPGSPIPLDFFPSTIWASPKGAMLYVAGGTESGGVVVPIDTTTDQVLPPIPVGMEPYNFALTPNGKVLFVLDEGKGANGPQGGEGDIAPIDTSTDQPGPPILPNTVPTSMVMTPNGETLYVTDDGSVYPIDVSTDQTGPPIKIAGGPDAIAVTPNGEVAYVESANGTVTPIDTATNLPGRPISVGTEGPFSSGIVITPNGRTVYVQSAAGPQENSRYLVPIDTATSIPGPAIQIPDDSIDMVLAPDGRTLYLAPYNAKGNDVAVINTKTNTVESVVKVAADVVLPGQMVVTPNSRTLYVDGVPGKVIPVAVATNTVGPSIASGTATVLVMSPNGKTLYALDQNLSPAPVPPIIPIRQAPGFCAPCS
jgi:YVTN family beta-propeller protein